MTVRIPGLIDTSLNLLKCQHTGFTKMKRDVIPSYNEMKVKLDICYDSFEDVLRPHKNVQVLVVRSLVDKWKQPIFYDWS